MNLRSVYRFASRMGLLTISTIAVVALLVAVVLTPLALDFVNSKYTRNEWEIFSFIGQSYGAASTILSGLALLSVGFSIFLQVSDARKNREQGMRMLHLELLRMSLESPQYLECWGAFSSSSSPDVRRQHIYTNLIVSHWQTAFEVGYLNEAELRVMSKRFFAGEVGREFWNESRVARFASAPKGESRLFMEILDDEYKKACVAGEPSIKRGSSTTNADKYRWSRKRSNPN